MKLNEIPSFHFFFFFFFFQNKTYFSTNTIFKDASCLFLADSRYLGCWRDNISPHRDLSDGPNYISYNAPDVCIEYCKEKGNFNP